MKLLLISDNEEHALWGSWSDELAKRLSEVSLILSAGDLLPAYLEFLVTMLNVPLVYVRGNHDWRYESEPPQGCIDADGKVVEAAGLRILGFGGSMRYKPRATDMYTEREMAARIRKAERGLALRSLSDRLTGAASGQSAPPFDILLTHAPCRGFGDMDDLAHTGFECFNNLLNKYSPPMHCYGHVHREYGAPVKTESVSGFHRQIRHPSGTTLVNASGYIIVEI